MPLRRVSHPCGEPVGWGVLDVKGIATTRTDAGATCPPSSARGSYIGIVASSEGQLRASTQELTEVGAELERLTEGSVALWSRREMAWSLLEGTFSARPGNGRLTIACPREMCRLGMSSAPPRDGVSVQADAEPTFFTRGLTPWFVC
jgi:hypothetical protein